MSYAASQLHFVRQGRGAPLMLLHGNPATHTLWRPLIDSLSARHTTIAPDLPGFGGSPAPESRKAFALESLARIILEFADLQGLERFDLIGHSFGGAVSATVAGLAPERIRSLALITPLGTRIPPLGRLVRFRLLPAAAELAWKEAPEEVRRVVGRTLSRYSYGAGFGTERGHEVAREASARHDLARSSSALMMNADLPRYAETLRRLNDECDMPLMLIGCRHDRIVPYEHFEKVCEKLPRAFTSVFREGGHVPMWQYPEELTRMLERFYASRDHT